MTISRRKFLNSTLKLGGLSLLPPAVFKSCLPARKKEDLIIDFIGTRQNFDIYKQYLNKIRGIRISKGSLDASLSNESDIILMDTGAETKSAYLLLFLEQGKDILTTYPMGSDLSEYASISEFMESSGRFVGLMNPLVFFPSLRMLREIIRMEKITLKQIRINCHPVNLVGDFRVEGPTGTAQALQRIVSFISDDYPLSLIANTDDNKELDSIHIQFEGFQSTIQLNGKQLGWNLELRGENFTALSDHTGLLAVRNEVKPRMASDPAIMDKAIKANIEDFLQAVRERSEPSVNHIDGLASIVLNRAVKESLITGASINL